MQVDQHRASALRFGDARVQALFTVLDYSVFNCGVSPTRKFEVRALLAPLRSFDPAHYPLGKMTYDLPRLRLHRIIERIPHSHRYQVTQQGLRVAVFFSRSYTRLLRPKLAQIMPTAPPGNSPLRDAFDQLQKQIDRSCEEQKLAP